MSHGSQEHRWVGTARADVATCAMHDRMDARKHADAAEGQVAICRPRLHVMAVDVSKYDRNRNGLGSFGGSIFLLCYY